LSANAEEHNAGESLTAEEAAALDNALEREAFLLTAAAIKSVPGGVPNNQMSVLVTTLSSIAVSLKRIADHLEKPVG
jgi:hypothetical protein